MTRCILWAFSVLLLGCFNSNNADTALDGGPNFDASFDTSEPPLGNRAETVGSGDARLDSVIRAPVRPEDYEELFMIVQWRRDGPFEFDWNGTDIPLVIALGPERQDYQFSIATDQVGDLSIKVRFCRDRNCQDLTDPVSEMWFPIESPFYRGEVTEWTFDEIWRIPECLDDECSEFTDPQNPAHGRIVGGCQTMQNEYPTWTCVVARCDVRCAAVVGVAAGGYCEFGQTGPHFCE